MKPEVVAVTVCSWIMSVHSFASSQVVFTEKPGPGPVAVPVGGQVIFNCSVGPEDMITGWRVFVPSVSLEYFTDSPSNARSLASLGITVREDGGFLSSQLIVNAAQENLLTYASCEARIGTDDTTLTDSRVDIIIYGPPEAPTNLSLCVEDGLLTVIWFSSTIPNVPLTFALALTNLETSKRKELTIYDAQRHQFTVEDVQACDVLEVLVTGRNSAGVSSHAAINGSLPGLPDRNALQHSLSKSSIGGGVTLTVTFTMPKPCLVDPVMSYTLAVILEDSEQNTTEKSRPSSGPAVSLKVEGLKEKATYTYSIIAFNALGSTSTASTSFVTANVQAVRVCLVEGSTYSIKCSYIAGSTDASGCSYVLVGLVDDISDIKGTIDGTSTVKEVIHNTKDYGSILVYGEGDLLVMNKTLGKIRSCSSDGNGSNNTIYFISGLTALCVVAVMITSAVILISMYKIMQRINIERQTSTTANNVVVNQESN